MAEITSPLPAIKEYCLDCVGRQRQEVQLCPTKHCALWAFRMGTNPFRKKREMSEETLQKLRDNMIKVKEGAEDG